MLNEPSKSNLKVTQHIGSNSNVSFFFNFRIKQADILVVIIDVKAHFGEMRIKGVSEFIASHVTDQLGLDAALVSGEKALLVSLNKTDLLDNDQLEWLNNELQVGNEQRKGYSISKISCTPNNDKINNHIDELMCQLSKRIANLCVLLYCGF